MKRIASLLIVLILLCSCRENNGPIGLLYGSWKIVTITSDDPAQPAYDANLFMQFQDHVVCLREVYDRHYYGTAWGSWSQVAPDSLMLDFTHSDSNRPPGNGYYTPQAATGIPPMTRAHMLIVSQSQLNMTLRYTNPSGYIYTYRLKKWL